MEYVSARPLAVAVHGYPTDWLLAAPGRARLVGLLVIGVVGLGVVWPLRRGPRYLSGRGRALSLSCLALLVCTTPAAWKNDIAYVERMNHVPLCLAAILIAAATGPGSTTWYRQARRYAVPVMAGVSLVVGAGGLATAPRSESWLARFREVEQQHRQADAFVYAESDLDDWWYDQLASLSLAMPNAIVLSPTGEAAKWPVRPFTVLSVDEYRRSPPKQPFLSDAARALVGSS